MSLLTLDASVAAAWVLPDERSDAADDLLRRGRAGDDALQAPALWLWETGNVLELACRRGRLARREAQLAFDLLSRAGVFIEPLPDVDRLRGTAEIARDLGVTFYDAAYLEQARRTGAALVTRDRRLHVAAAKIGVECPTL